MTATVEEVCREHWGRLLALLTVRCGDVAAAEDALADAVEAALRRWPVDGTPREPAAWLLTVAKRRLLDRAKHEATVRSRQPVLGAEQIIDRRRPTSPVEDAVIDATLPDERLHLILLCCHPALPLEAQAALALRLVMGVPTAEVARLFLVPAPTMAARITRAKRRIATSAVPLAAEPEEFAARVDAAVRAIYLAFTAGYAPGSGDDLTRSELAGEAVRLARLLVGFVPGEPAARALCALLLLQHARRDARVSPDGRLVLLPDQDRDRWHHTEIDEGLALLRGIEPTSELAQELTLQAQIAAVHDTAPSAAATDWASIAAAYARLEELTGNPVVRLNRAVAVAEAEGPMRGLALLEGLEQHLPRSHRLPAVRGELLARAGATAAAAAALDEAIARCGNGVERAHLHERRRALGQVRPTD